MDEEQMSSELDPLSISSTRMDQASSRKIPMIEVGQMLVS